MAKKKSKPEVEVEESDFAQFTCNEERNQSK